MAINDPTPVTLRPADQADDTEALVLELAELLRTANGESAYLLIVLRDATRDTGRRVYRAEAEALQIQETIRRTQESLSALSRSLRAAGKL